MSNNPSSAICLTHIGARETQEDNFLLNGVYLTPERQKQLETEPCCFFQAEHRPGVALFAVSDGMGGHHAGEVASLMCVQMLADLQKQLQAFRSLDRVVERIQAGISEINRSVFEQSMACRSLKGMGATLVLLVQCGTQYAVLNIGDSRAYAFSHGKLTQMTKDHTEGQRMLDLGLLSQKELASFPARKHLNRYVGLYSEGFLLRADEYALDLEDGMVLLCSDGVSDALSHLEMETILRTEPDCKKAGEQIICKTAMAPNADNATVMLIPIRG